MGLLSMITSSIRFFFLLLIIRAIVPLAYWGLATSGILDDIIIPFLPDKNDVQPILKFRNEVVSSSISLSKSSPFVSSVIVSSSKLLESLSVSISSSSSSSAATLMLLSNWSQYLREMYDDDYNNKNNNNDENNEDIDSEKNTPIPIIRKKQIMLTSTQLIEISDLLAREDRQMELERQQNDLEHYHQIDLIKRLRDKVSEKLDKAKELMQQMDDMSNLLVERSDGLSSLLPFQYPQHTNNDDHDDEYDEYEETLEKYQPHLSSALQSILLPSNDPTADTILFLKQSSLDDSTDNDIDHDGSTHKVFERATQDLNNIPLSMEHKNDDDDDYVHVFHSLIALLLKLRNEQRQINLQSHARFCDESKLVIQQPSDYDHVLDNDDDGDECGNDDDDECSKDDETSGMARESHLNELVQQFKERFTNLAKNNNNDDDDTNDDGTKKLPLPDFITQPLLLELDKTSKDLTTKHAAELQSWRDVFQTRMEDTVIEMENDIARRQEEQNKGDDLEKEEEDKETEKGSIDSIYADDLSIILDHGFSAVQSGEDVTNAIIQSLLTIHQSSNQVLESIELDDAMDTNLSFPTESSMRLISSLIARKKPLSMALLANPALPVLVDAFDDIIESMAGRDENFDEFIHYIASVDYAESIIGSGIAHGHDEGGTVGKTLLSALIKGMGQVHFPKEVLEKLESWNGGSTNNNNAGILSP